MGEGIWKLMLKTDNSMFMSSFMTSGLFYLNSLDRFISYIEGVWLVFVITMFYKSF